MDDEAIQKLKHDVLPFLFKRIEAVEAWAVGSRKIRARVGGLRGQGDGQATRALLGCLPSLPSLPLILELRSVVSPTVRLPKSPYTAHHPHCACI